MTGTRVTAVMAINNNCTYELTVPWTIARNSELLHKRTLTIPAGSTMRVKAAWVSYAGKHHFSGDADMMNTLGDNTRSNNTRAADIFIAPILTPQPLDTARAMAAGAQFRGNLGVATIGDPYSWVQYTDCFTLVQPGTTPTLRLGLDCRQQRPGSAEPEAFVLSSGEHFVLKNG